MLIVSIFFAYFGPLFLLWWVASNMTDEAIKKTAITASFIPVMNLFLAATFVVGMVSAFIEGLKGE